MEFRRFFTFAVLFLTATASVAIVPGDASRGAELFKSEKCITCHSVNGQGGTIAPDLARGGGSQFTPSTMAALMWNHAPAMWSAMEKAGIEKPKLSPEQAADLFAYFYAFRYFEKPGDAARGKRVFESKGCAGCHGQSASGPVKAPPVTSWGPTIYDPVELTRAMWNHAPQMNAAVSQRKIKWPQLTPQELTDLVVYVQNLPGEKKAEREFAAGPAETGKELFQLKGCSGCHQGPKMSLERRLHARTPVDLAAAMWNHAPQMRVKAKEIRPEEMKRLVGYLWSIQYFESPGDAGRGKRVFAEKKCGSCHGQPSTGAPSFASLSYKLDTLTMVSALWQHGPQMLELMKQKNIPWPRFRDRQVADLIAYINSREQSGAAGAP